MPSTQEWTTQLPPSPPHDWPLSSWAPAPGPSGPPPTPGRPPTRWWIPVAAVIVVLALVGGAFVGTRVLRTDDVAVQVAPDPTTPPTTAKRAPSTTEPSSPSTTLPDLLPSTPSPTTPRTPPTPDAVKAEVAELQKFVEQERGLKFKEDVEVEVLAPDEFEADIREQLEKESASLEEQGVLLQATGLLDPGKDPTEAITDLYGSGVLGYYDPITKALVVRGDRISPFFREIVVHELTHALEDQHFDLDRPEIDEASDDPAWSWTALVEGSAKQVENAYVEQLSPADEAELQQEQMELGMDQAGSMSDPDAFALAMLMMSPYDEGEPFVEALLAGGGQSTLDRAFGAPPKTSEQVLHPEKFAAGEGAVAVPAPPAEGAVVQEGTLGELMTGYMVNGADMEAMTQEILDKIMSGEIDPEDVLGGDMTGLGDLLKVKTISGWGGDRYVVWKQGSGVCMRTDWVADSPAAQREMASALDSWAGRDRSVRIDNPSPDKLRATRCTS